MQVLKHNSRTAKTLSWLILPVEKFSKEIIFDCHMCGQCILHSTGMTCPMRCPKNLRNGPCGGVRANGNCEVHSDKPCTWTMGINRAPHLPLWSKDIHHLQPPVNWRLRNSSSWVNLLTGVDMIRPVGWENFYHKEHKENKD
jgi:hypothetical protein